MHVVLATIGHKPSFPYRLHIPPSLLLKYLKKQTKKTLT